MKHHIPLHIYDEVFGRNFYVSYGVAAEELQRSVKINIGKEWEAVINKGDNGKCMFFESPKCNIIWIWTKKRDVTILAHECLHASFYAFGERTIKLDDNSQELFAYYISMLMRKTLHGRV